MPPKTKTQSSAKSSQFKGLDEFLEKSSAPADAI